VAQLAEEGRVSGKEGRFSLLSMGVHQTFAAGKNNNIANRGGGQNGVKKGGGGKESDFGSTCRPRNAIVHLCKPMRVRREKLNQRGSYTEGEVPERKKSGVLKRNAPRFNGRRDTDALSVY